MERPFPDLSPTIEGRRRVMACHSATLSGDFPPNSLAAIEECVAAAVPRIEVDVRFMADDSMVIFHDERLDRDATGSGSLSRMRRGDLRHVRYRSDERHGLCFLEDVVDRLRGSETLLQVDLKLSRPISPERASALQELLAPMREQLIVGSQAHWNLRALSGLPVAFDPSLQFHHDAGQRPAGMLPASLGLHGLWDDAPYARNPNFTAAEYVSARLLDAWQLLPGAVEWMVDIETISHVGALGVELGWWLAERGCGLAAWTFKERTPNRREVARRMLSLGATALITDCAITLAGDISGPGRV